MEFLPIGKLTRKDYARYPLPHHITDFWTVLSACCATAPPASHRPAALIRVNTIPIKALFDTGSTVTLINSSFKPEILGSLANSVQIAQQPSLCGADGLPLSTAGTYSLPVVISGTHPVTFINNLQVDALIGMDLMHKCKISIDVKHNQICLSGQSGA